MKKERLFLPHEPLPFDSCWGEKSLSSVPPIFIASSQILSHEACSLVLITGVSLHPAKLSEMLHPFSSTLGDEAGTICISGFPPSPDLWEYMVIAP
jgi:hypothetical protein